MHQGQQFLGPFVLGYMTRWLEERARRLMSRLHEQLDLSDRMKPAERRAEAMASAPALFRITAMG